MRIDAHHHVWRLARGDYGWLTPEMTAIYRDFSPEDLAPALATARIDRTVLVQAAPSEAETRWLLETAAQTSFVAGVVGWVDFDGGDATRRIEECARDTRLVGLRPMIQDIGADDWMLGDAATGAARAMAEAGLRFDALVKPRHLPHLRRFVARHRDLRIVIDHGAKPDIATGAFDDWLAMMRAVAAEGDVHCKLSGLITEAAADWTDADVTPYIEALIDVFGPYRLMWGSDWPVLNLKGDYARWARLCARATARLKADEQAAIWGETAVAFYGLAT